jgi:hypothetical protein
MRKLGFSSENSAAVHRLCICSDQNTPRQTLEARALARFPRPPNPFQRLLSDPSALRPLRCSYFVRRWAGDAIDRSNCSTAR